MIEIKEKKSFGILGVSAVSCSYFIRIKTFWEVFLYAVFLWVTAALLWDIVLKMTFSIAGIKFHNSSQNKK